MNRCGRFVPAALVLLAVLARAQTGEPEVTSALGVKHYARADEKGAIAEAERKLAADPRNIELLLALGRAQADVWRYRAAIETYTRGLQLAPNDARLYRHRGHRLISVREFDRAQADLERAAQLNDRDFDIWYHLGLARYLRGDFAAASAAYERCRAVAQTDDQLIAVSDWLYMAYRRARKEAEAAKVLGRITPGMGVKENTSYFARLLFYQGIRKESELLNIEKATDLEIATLGYGLGNWHLCNGDVGKAREYFSRIVSGGHWPAFGFIAAEAELARRK